MNEKPVMRINMYGNQVWHLPSKGTYYLHREDGPAVIYSEKNSGRGKFPYAWLVHNESVSPKKVQAWMKENGFTERDFGTPGFGIAFKLGFL